MIDAYMVTVSVPERHQVLARIVPSTMEDLNVMGLWFNTEPAAVGKRVRGFTNKKTTGAYTAWNIQEWEWSTETATRWAQRHSRVPGEGRGYPSA